MAVIEAGEGPTVLLLHGVGLKAEAWSPIIDDLSKRYHVIAPDMPGHGASLMISDLNSLRDYVEAIAPLLTQKSIVVGHSMGAMIALGLASRFEDQVSAVAAMNAVFERDENAKSSVSARAAMLDGKTVSDPSQTLHRWFGESQSQEQEACRRWLLEVDPFGYKAAYGVFASEDGPSRELLSSLAMPALFMTGADEPNSTPAMSKAMAELVPNGKAVVLNGAAHMMPMTHSQNVVEALASFLKEAL